MHNKIILANVELIKDTQNEIFVGYCTCDIPQHFHLDCSHILYFKNSRNYIKYSNYTVRDPSLTREAYYEYYNSIKLKLPSIGKHFETKLEIISVDQNKFEVEGSIEIENKKTTSGIIPIRDMICKSNENTFSIDEPTNTTNEIKKNVLIYYKLIEEQNENQNSLKRKLSQEKDFLYNSLLQELENNEKLFEKQSKFTIRTVYASQIDSLKKKKEIESKPKSIDKKKLDSKMKQKEDKKIEHIMKKETNSTDDDAIITKYHSKFDKLNGKEFMKDNKQNIVPKKPTSITEMICDEEEAKNVKTELADWFKQLDRNDKTCVKKAQKFIRNRSDIEQKNLTSSATYFLKTKFNHEWLNPFKLDLIVKYLNDQIKINKKDIFIIESNYKSTQHILNWIELNPEKNLFIYPEFYGRDDSGHWVLNILLKEERKIYIVDSLQPVRQRKCLFSKTFPDHECFVVKNIPRQKGVECGYWVCFYMFLIVKFLHDFNEFHFVINDVSEDFFGLFCKFLNTFCNEICSTLARLPKPRLDEYP